MLAIRCALSSLLAAVMFCATAPSQAPSPWSTLTVPGGVDPSKLTLSDSLLVYRDGNYLRAFSAVTSEWHAFTLSSGTWFTQTQDLLLVPEGDRWTGFSAYRGRFEPLFVNYWTTTMRIDESVAAVYDDDYVHAFSAYTGRWHTHARPANTVVQLSARTVLVRTTATTTPGTASAFDAYRGQWHDVPTQTNNVTVARLAGSNAVVGFGNEVYGFSATRGGWSHTTTTGFGSNTNSYPYGDLIAAHGHVFNGVLGTFSPSPFGGSNGSLEAWAHTARGLYNGAWQVLGAASANWTALPPTVNTGGGLEAVALFRDADTAYLYSSINDTLIATPHDYGLGSSQSHGCMITLRAPTTDAPLVFNGLSGQLVSGPADSLPGTPWAGRLAAGIYTTTGLAALSAYGTGFTPIAAPDAQFVWSQSNALLAIDDAELHVFDALRDRWRSLPLALADRVDPTFGRNALICRSNSHAYGYSVDAGEFHPLALPEPAITQAAKGDLAYVRTANHLIAYTSVGDVHSWHAFPDDFRATSAGASTTLQCRVPTGSLAVLAIGPAASSPGLTPFGELWIDANQLATAVMLAPPGEVRASLPLTLPAEPALKNTTWLTQTLTLPATGTAYLSAASKLHVL